MVMLPILHVSSGGFSVLTGWFSLFMCMHASTVILANQVRVIDIMARMTMLHIK